MIRRSFVDLSVHVFIPLVRPHFEYIDWPNLNANAQCLDQIQQFLTKLVKGFHRLPYLGGLQRLHSPCRRHLRGDLIAAFKVLTGELNFDPSLFFVSPALPDLRSHPLKILQGPGCRKSPFTVRVVMIWNSLPTSLVTTHSVNLLTQKLD